MHSGDIFVANFHKVTDEKKITERKVVCPNCGKAMPIRIMELRGILKYSILCKGCKQVSVVEVKDIESHE